MNRKPIVVGLVGAGEISNSHLPHLIAMGCEVRVFSEKGAAEAVARHGGVVIDTLLELIAQVDIVDIVTPTFTHGSIIEAALLAGKDVITEKPLTRSVEEAEHLRKLAHSTGRTILPAHVVRYFPEYWLLKQAVAAGELGDLAVLRFSRSSAYPTRSAWFGDSARSGGIIMDQMIHDLDIARWVAGEIVSVSAEWTSVPHASEPSEAAQVLLTHESGAISHVAGLWGPQHLEFTTEFSVTGTAGTLTHSSRKQRDIVTDLAENLPGGETIPDGGVVDNPYALELSDFLDAIRTGRAARVSLDDGVMAVAIANAAIRSATAGHPVEFERTEAS